MHDYDREVMGQFVRLQDEDRVAHMRLDHPFRLVPYAAAEALRHGPGGHDPYGWAHEHEGQTVMGVEVIGSTSRALPRFVMDSDHLTYYSTVTTLGGPEVLGQGLDPDTLVYRARNNMVIALMVEPDALCFPDNPWCEYSDEHVSADPASRTEYICLAHHGKALPERGN